MKNIQLTLNDELLDELDRVCKHLNTSRSDFTSMALRDALGRYRLEQLEHVHRQGYEQHPVHAEEFSVWETEQIW